MFVTPLEVFSLVDRLHFPELTILLVLLSQVDAVSTIFMIVPPMIVVAVPIVVLPVVIPVAGSPDRHWSN